MNDKEKGNQLTMTSSEWHYGDANFVDSSIRLGHGENPMSVCASGSMMDSFCHSVWEHPSNSQPLGFSEMDVHNVASTSESFRMGVEANFDASSLMFKTGLFLPSLTGVLPHSLSQFPADSGFIERAARFSSFNGGNFSDMVNPFGIHQHPNPYLQGGSPLHMARPSIDVSLNEEHRAAEGSPSKDERKHEKSCDEPNHGARVSGNDSDEADFSAGRSRGQEDEDPSSGKGLSSKKRKRGGQDTEPEKANGAQQQTSEQNEDCNPTSTPKTSARHGKQASQALDSPTDEYIHVRARRGQATNSHSLAERVRREKISERMKFLQDLVPGCSKVTGKAVMLDEIINYVQSLQRQVEFLSMKLATVNPRLDVNIERLLAKDQLFSAQPGPPLALRFSPSMPIPYIPMNPPQPSILEPGNSSDLLRRTVDSHLTSMNLGYKEPSPQVPNVWEDELHNVVQMGCNAGTPPTGQDTNSTLPRGHMKTEP